MVEKVVATEAALELVAQLQAQYETWKHTQLIIDVIEGTGGTFSLEGATGKAFHTRSRVFTAQELVELEIVL